MALHERGELRVGRRKKTGVQQAEEPGPLSRPGSEEGRFASGVRRIHFPGQLARDRRGGQLIIGDFISQPRRRANSQYADGRNGDHDEREPGAKSHE